MGEACEAFDVFARVAGVGAGAEGRAADIDRVGAVKDRLDAEIGVLGGRQEFKRNTRHATFPRPGGAL